MFSKSKFYSVYINPTSGEPLLDIEVVKNGFSLWAFLFTGLWAIYNKVWQMLIIFILVQGIFVLGLKYGFLTEDLVNALGMVFSVWLGFEAANMKEESLSQRGLVLFDIVCAIDEDDAKVKFINRYQLAKSNQPHNDLTSKKSGKEFIFDDVSPFGNKSDSFA